MVISESYNDQDQVFTVVTRFIFRMIMMRGMTTDHGLTPLGRLYQDQVGELSVEGRPSWHDTSNAFRGLCVTSQNITIQMRDVGVGEEEERLDNEAESNLRRRSRWETWKRRRRRRRKSSRKDGLVSRS